MVEPDVICSYKPKIKKRLVTNMFPEHTLSEDSFNISVFILQSLLKNRNTNSLLSP